jgi:hypothetical protein
MSAQTRDIGRRRIAQIDRPRVECTSQRLCATSDSRWPSVVGAFLLTVLAGVATAQAEARFKDLGLALNVDPMTITVSTQDAQGRRLAFGRVHDKGNNHYDVFVVDLENGALEWLGLQARFSAATATYVQIARATNGHVYLFNGDPGNFSKYDVNARRLIDLGRPGGGQAKVNYVFGHGTGVDGKIYIAGYPSAHTFVCDPASDQIVDLGCMTEDPQRQKYAYPPQVDGRNEWLYVPLGLHHLELCAYNLKTGEKRQILPPELTMLPGNPLVVRGIDGNVYGSVSQKGGDRFFRCSATGIDEVDRIPAPDRSGVPQMVGDVRFSEILADGKLTVTEPQGKSKVIQTSLNGITYGIYSIGCEREGVIYGGGGNGRAHVFAYDPKRDALRDLGRGAGGRVQLYDLLDHPNGIYATTYGGAHLELFKVESGEWVHLEQLSIDHGQERLQQLTLGPDGMIYTGAVPIKGRLGGAIVRLNPTNHAVTVWRDVVANQSFNAVAAVPATGEMFFTSSIRGGTSATPSEKEACVILWNCADEKAVWRGQPIAGTTDYSYATVAGNGMIYGVAGRQYYAFDPVRREVVYRGELPVAPVRPLGFSHHAAGSRGLIYGAGEDAIFAIDPKDHGARIVARHPSLKQGRGFYVSRDETIYYGSGAHLWCARLDGDKPAAALVR